MTSTQIKYFIAAVRLMNFSDAAESLYVSQPALSRAIGNLEEELGFKLFERNNNMLTLTEGGDMLYTWFIAQLPHLDSVIKRARKLSNASLDNLSVGIVDNDNIPENYAKGVSEYIADNPGVNFSFHHFDTAAQAVNDTLKNDIDISIVMQSAVMDESGLETIPIYTYKRNVAMSLNHPLANNKVVSIKDFKDDTFIVINAEASPFMTKEIHQICKGFGFTPNVIEGKSVKNVIEMVEEGKGVALLYVGHAERYNNLVKFVDIKENITVNQVIAYSKENRNPNIRAFLERIQKYQI